MKKSNLTNLQKFIRNVRGLIGGDAKNRYETTVSIEVSMNGRSVLFEFDGREECMGIFPLRPDIPRLTDEEIECLAKGFKRDVFGPDLAEIEEIWGPIDSWNLN